ncbi:hypothetical protein DFH07DRAFT_760873, partial [Mycena maculata]
ELIDAILDFLHDDRQSLLHSSLVARKWVPATRYHIFERIAINHFLAGQRGYRQYRDNAHDFPRYLWLALLHNPPIHPECGAECQYRVHPYWPRPYAAGGYY